MNASSQLHDLAGSPPESGEPDSRSGRFGAQKNILLHPEIDPGLPPAHITVTAPPVSSHRTSKIRRSFAQLHVLNKHSQAVTTQTTCHLQSAVISVPFTSLPVTRTDNQNRGSMRWSSEVWFWRCQNLLFQRKSPDETGSPLRAFQLRIKAGAWSSPHTTPPPHTTKA
jgi:hypothetical protein